MVTKKKEAPKKMEIKAKPKAVAIIAKVEKKPGKKK